MFVSITNLNEGGCRDRCSGSKKRELFEGENPKSSTTDWGGSRSKAHANSNWQKLRK